MLIFFTHNTLLEQLTANFEVERLVSALCSLRWWYASLYAVSVAIRSANSRFWVLDGFHLYLISFCFLYPLYLANGQTVQQRYKKVQNKQQIKQTIYQHTINKKAPFMGLYSCLYQFPICMLCKPYFPQRKLFI